MEAILLQKTIKTTEFFNPRIKIKHQSGSGKLKLKMPNPIISLCMIVKNEEKNIKRCIDSALPFINSFTIVDTGSTDSTISMIESLMKEYKIPGIIVKMEWKNFGFNRTAALQLCRDKTCADWAIMIDADDSLEGTPVPFDSPIWKPKQENLDGYTITVKHGGLTHERVHVFNLLAHWLYIGVVHEYPACSTTPIPSMTEKKAEDAPKTVQLSIRMGRTIKIPGNFMTNVARTEGCRSQDPVKYLRDAKTLTEELIKDPRSSRNTFYLAQSLRDSGLWAAAAPYYKARATMEDTWIQERYISYFNLIERTINRKKQLAYAWKAVELVPNRLEVPYSLMRSRRMAKCDFPAEVFALAMVASLANKENVRKPPEGSLFILHNVYEYAFDDELAILASWVSGGHKALSVSIYKRLLATKSEVIPKDQLERIKNNLSIDEKALGSISLS
jgi:glycosyltransferase involved in cell wall biosynthesis